MSEINHIKPINDRINPLNGRIIIKADKPKEKSSGGIILPENHENLIEGTVVAVSSHRYEHGKLIESSIEVGNKVIFLKDVGYQLPFEEEEYLILDITQIFAIINKMEK